MASQKRILVLTEEQYHIIINALNHLRTKCLEENISAIDVDELLLQVIDCPIKSKELSHDAR